MRNCANIEDKRIDFQLFSGEESMCVTVCESLKYLIVHPKVEWERERNEEFCNLSSKTVKLNWFTHGSNETFPGLFIEFEIHDKNRYFSIGRKNQFPPRGSAHYYTLIQGERMQKMFVNLFIFENHWFIVFFIHNE